MTETLAVAGVVIVVAAAVGGGLKLLGAEVPVMSSVARQLLAGVIGGSLLAAAFVAEAYEGDPTVTTIAPSPPAALRPAGQITVPAGGRVTRQMLAAGQARHVPFGSSLFLLVERGRYYPQKGVVPLRPDGHWAATVSFGNSDTPGVAFTLHLVVAGPVSVDVFDRYFKATTFPGLSAEELPPDLTFLDSVDVVRG